MTTFSLVGPINGLVSMFYSPSTINIFWNGRSSSGLSLLFQVISGLLISIFVVILSFISFFYVEYIMEELFLGSGYRYVHANMCSVVFMVLWIHWLRGYTIGSAGKQDLWKSGFLMFALAMGSAFLGYVLPWRQISFWGATVITSLATVAPGGISLLLYLWGGFSLGSATLGRFLSLHFLLPLVIIGLLIVHLLLLHMYNSSSMFGLNGGVFAISFIWKDLITICLIILFCSFLVSCVPAQFIEADNWIDANPIVTPEHIKPEWYFLFLYAVLRCIPDKLVGVLGLVGGLLMIIILFLSNSFLSSRYWLMIVFLLTWLGGLDILAHFVYSSQILSGLYFLLPSL